MLTKPSASILFNRLFLQSLKNGVSRLPRSTAFLQSLGPTSTVTTNPFKQQLKVATTTVIKPEDYVDADKLVAEDLKAMIAEIHQELEIAAYESNPSSELVEMSKYYFDGQGKAIRPVIAMTLGHAFNHHMGKESCQTVIGQQRKVAIISEMIHTASLVHDDVLDHAETRRGKVSVNRRWNITKSAMCGDYILAVGAKVLAQLHNEEVLIVLAQVLADLVRGEFQQLQTLQLTSDTSERFKRYLSKTFHKTASLIAYSCKANAILSTADPALIEDAYQYGSNIGIAFQLIDDLLDFESSSALLGKPAGADLKLGLATAPVLFATTEFPELEDMIGRRFEGAGDVEAAFDFVKRSNGLELTREEARKHCSKAARAIEGIKGSSYKSALLALTEKSLERKK